MKKEIDLDKEGDAPFNNRAEEEEEAKTGVQVVSASGINDILDSLKEDPK